MTTPRGQAAGAQASAAFAFSGRGEWLLILAAAAAILGTGLSGPSMGVLWLPLLAALLLCAVHSGPDGVALPREPVTLALLALAAWLAAVAVASPVSNVALHGYLAFACLPAAYVATRLLAADGAGWRRLARAGLYAGMLAALWGLAQKYLLAQPPTSAFAMANTHAAFLNFIVLPLVAACLGAAGNGRRRLLGCLALVGFATASGLGRGPLLGFLLGLGLIAWLLRRDVPARAWHAPAAILGACFAVAWTLDSWAMPQRIAGMLQMTFVSLGGEGGPFSQEAFLAGGIGSIEERYLIWKVTLAMIAAAPWHGAGFGAFHMRYPAFRSDLDTSSGDYAHSDYLQFLLEFGWPGLALLLLALAAVAWLVRRGWTAGGVPPAARPEAAGLAAALLALVVDSAFSYSLYIPPMLLVAGLLLARLHVLAGTGSGPGWRPLAGRMRPAIWRALLLAIGGSMTLVLGAMIGMGYSYERARSLMLEGDLAGAARALDRAERLQETEAVQTARAVLCTEAAALVPAGDAARLDDIAACARASAIRALEINPWYPDAWYRTGRAYETFRARLDPAWRTRAYSAYRNALAREPRHFRARASAARLLAGAGRDADARALLERGIAYRMPDDPDVLDYARLLAGLRRTQGDLAGAAHLDRQVADLEAHFAGAGGP